MCMADMHIICAYGFLISIMQANLDTLDAAHLGNH